VFRATEADPAAVQFASGLASMLELVIRLEEVVLTPRSVDPRLLFTTTKLEASNPDPACTANVLVAEVVRIEAVAVEVSL
jgi:hypothetical protein